MAEAAPHHRVRIKQPSEEEEEDDAEQDAETGQPQTGTGHDVEEDAPDEETPLIMRKKSTFSKYQRRRPALLEAADDSEEEMTFMQTYKTVIGEMIGDNTRFDWIVEADAFQDYPGALFWARMTQIFISMVVFISFGVMMLYYFMGVIQTDREWYWYSEIEVPTLVVCPDMNSMTGNLRSGSNQVTFNNFTVTAAVMDTYPDSTFPEPINHTVVECVQGPSCRCIEFPDKPIFSRRWNGTDIVRIVFRTTTNGKSYLFGFHRNKDANKDEVPHTFSYGSFGMRVLGYVTLRLVDRKSAKVEGFYDRRWHELRDKHIYDWAIGGLAVPSEDRFDSEIAFGMSSFQVARDQTFKGLFSPFAIMTVVAVCMSIINNLNVFGLMFPVQDHPVFTQREPSLFIRQVFSCFRCVQRRKRNLQRRTRLEKLVVEHQEHLRHAMMSNSPQRKRRRWSSHKHAHERGRGRTF